MRIISRKRLNDYSETHPEVKPYLDAWYYEVKHADWNSPDDVKKKYPKSRNIGKDRVIFDILRNRFRLVIRVNYPVGIVYIRFIGTHKEYNHINVEEV